MTLCEECKVAERHQRDYHNAVKLLEEVHGRVAAAGHSAQTPQAVAV